LPVTLLIDNNGDNNGCEVGAVEGGVKWDSAKAKLRGAEGRVESKPNRRLRR
jgi:hypothetical protein